MAGCLWLLGICIMRDFLFYLIYNILCVWNYTCAASPLPPLEINLFMFTVRSCCSFSKYLKFSFAPEHITAKLSLLNTYGWIVPCPVCSLLLYISHTYSPPKQNKNSTNDALPYNDNPYKSISQIKIKHCVKSILSFRIHKVHKLQTLPNEAYCFSSLTATLWHFHLK